MLYGNVKYFNGATGTGLITPDGGGADLYVNYRSIIMDGFQNLEEGQRVSFQVKEGPKGLEAIYVQIV